MLGISIHALMWFVRKQFNCEPLGVQYTGYGKVQTRMQDVNSSLSRLITWHYGSKSRPYTENRTMRHAGARRSCIIAFP